MIKKSSTIIKNWPKFLIQWGVLIALAIFLIPSGQTVDPEAYCPMGGIQALLTYLAKGTLPCSMSALQIVMGVTFAISIVLFSKLFCGFLCPLGTVQDLFIKWRKSLHIKGLTIKHASIADKALRIVKYALLFWIFYMTVSSSELFCKNFDPYYAVATGFKGEITLWMTIVSISILILGSFFIDKFWCKYICPLGAVSNSLKFWITELIVCGVTYWIAHAFQAENTWVYILAAFCIAGWLMEIIVARPKVQILHIYKDLDKCNHCGLCTKKCPYGIDLNRYGAKIDSVDCTLCGECVASCNQKALNVGVCKKSKGCFWKYIPAILTLILLIGGIWAGKSNKFEIPTIDVTWNTEQIDENNLETITITGLHSIKCYGSSMAFKANLQKINGIYGVKTFVNRHTADLLYNPKAITPEQIQEKIYVPGKFRVNPLNPADTDSLKIVTIRTEKMYDKMDINYLGMQIRKTDKKIYGLETEFECPLIVRIYADPKEEITEDWAKDVVEMKVLEMPVHGGGVKEIEVDYEFVELEEAISYISTADYLHKIFSPFKAELKGKDYNGNIVKRTQLHKDDEQFIYEFAHQNFEKPIYLRNMPFLSNHLSKHDGVIGVYLQLNKDLIPAIQIRYASPMTEDKLWELITMPKWTITYSADDIREVDAKLKFSEKGNTYKYLSE